MPADMNQADYDAFAAAVAANRADTGLRGVFADFLDENGRHEEAAYHRRWTPEVGAAEDWLKEFADKAGLDWGQVRRAAHDVASGTGNGMGVGVQWEAETAYDENMAEFWKNVEVLFGQEVPGDRRQLPFWCCEFDEPEADPLPFLDAQ